jgi:hypothetical protein
VEKLKTVPGDADDERGWLLVELAELCGNGSTSALKELVERHPDVRVWRLVAESIRTNRRRITSPLGYLRKATATAAERVARAGE